MKVALSVIGKFHTFDLARELHQRGLLQGVYSGYPMFKLRDEKLPAQLIHTFPWLQTPYMALTGRDKLGQRLLRLYEHWNRISFDHYTARSLSECDVFVGLSGSALITGRKARQRGIRYICDRGSSHIRAQNELLAQEHLLWREPFTGIDPRVIDREEAEYAEADGITVPSGFSARTFIEQGVPPQKVHRLPYGVNLGSFHATAQPAPQFFDILFAGGASLRKGIPYLLQAFQRLKHPRKRLFFAGAFSAEFAQKLQQLGLWSDHIQLLGHLQQAELRDRMSSSSVLVLPSIEDGFGLVMAQAMACGCPVIASENTGGSDLFLDGDAGFIVPIRRADLLADRLQQLADDPTLRNAMGQRALRVVQSFGGWQRYGDEAVAIYASLLQQGAPA
jgi:glycosyltransferase involved in cell wall biosynthesis